MTLINYIPLYLGRLETVLKQESIPGTLLLMSLEKTIADI